MACGDALGAGYEFEPPLPPDVEVVLTGGGGFGWKSGEWTDDTQMAVPILVAAETNGPLLKRRDCSHGRALIAELPLLGLRKGIGLSRAAGRCGLLEDLGPNVGNPQEPDF